MLFRVRDIRACGELIRVLEAAFMHIVILKLAAFVEALIIYLQSQGGL